MRKMATYIEIVNIDWNYNCGGSCPNCYKSVHGDNVVRCGIKYIDSGGDILVEPFNLCRRCYESIKEETS